MEAKSLYRKAFWLFFFGALLFFITAISVGVAGIAVFFGVAVRVGSGTAILVTIVSLAFAGLMVVRPESSDEKIRQWRAQELADEAWRSFSAPTPSDGLF